MDTKMIQLRCVAEGREGHWEAICLDWDLAVQGDSFENVYQGLNEALSGYLEVVKSYPASDRKRFLRRKAPFLLRLKYAAIFFLAYLVNSPTNTERHSFTAPSPCPV